MFNKEMVDQMLYSLSRHFSNALRGGVPYSSVQPPPYTDPDRSTLLTDSEQKVLDHLVDAYRIRPGCAAEPGGGGSNR